MVKTLKNLLLQNQKSYDLETWHVALGTQALQSLYKWWPWVDLDLFYHKVKLGHLYVWMGKTVIKSFNGGKPAAKDYIDWIILLMKRIWPQGVVCPCPGAIYLYMTTNFSSPEPSGSQGELIVYPYPGVGCRRRRRQQCLNIFFSETALPIKAKFYVEPPWEGGTKVHINGPGHMTKMATIPIYGKNL